MNDVDKLVAVVIQLLYTKTLLHLSYYGVCLVGTLLLVGCLAGCPIVMFKPRPPDHDTLGYFRKRGSIRSGSQVVSDDGVRSLA